MSDEEQNKTVEQTNIIDETVESSLDKETHEIVENSLEIESIVENPIIVEPIVDEVKVENTLDNLNFGMDDIKIF